MPDALADLCGETSDVVSLPTRLHWGPDNQYDLSDPMDTAIMYERVLREAPCVQDVTERIDADTLVHLWPRMILPPEDRALWEDRFPELRPQPRRLATPVRRGRLLPVGGAGPQPSHDPRTRLRGLPGAPTGPGR